MTLPFHRVAARCVAALALASMMLAAPEVHAQFAPFGSATIDNTTVTAAQTLSSGTGTITSTGAISFNGTTAALTISGSGTLLLTSGTVENTGASGNARALLADGTLIQINNQSTGVIRALAQDAVRSSTAGTSISLINGGLITANPNNTTVNPQQAIDWNSITTGSNTITNSGSILAIGADSVRPGVNGVITNGSTGIIRATPQQSGGNAGGSDGIDAQANTGVQVFNSGTIEGRAGITGGIAVANPPFTISVTNNTGATISGTNGSGINIDGVFATCTATITNQANATIKGNWDGVSANGDGDGIDVDGVLDLTNRGFIRALGANGLGSDGFPNGPDGVAAGGGTITNETGAEITASVLSGSATFSQAILIDDSSRGNSIAATTVINRGLIRSDNGAAIILISTFANNVTNDTGGTISGAGTASLGAAIQTGTGNDMVVNRGSIVGNNGLAIDMQGGINTLRIEGGAASIVGNISGGISGTSSLVFSPGAGNTFTYAGSLSNFATVQVDPGTTILSGSSLYTGTTTITNGGTLVARNSAVAGNSATGSGGVTVQNGGTLAGDGRIGGAVTVATGGRLSPSNNGAFTPAALTLGGDLNVTGSSRFTLALGASTGSSDRVTINGLLNYAGPGQLIFDVVDRGMATVTYDLVTFTSATGGLALGNLAFGNVPAGFSATFLLDGDSIGFTVTSVPEPGTIQLFGTVCALGFAGARWRVRRRRVCS